MGVLHHPNCKCKSVLRKPLERGVFCFTGVKKCGRLGVEGLMNNFQFTYIDAAFHLTIWKQNLGTSLSYDFRTWFAGSNIFQVGVF